MSLSIAKKNTLNLAPSLNFWENSLINLKILFGQGTVLDLCEQVLAKNKSGKEFGRAKLGSDTFYFFGHPEHAKYILHDHSQNFPRYTPTYTPKSYRLFKPEMGEGLVTTEGKIWKPKRKRSAPAFLGPVVKKYEPYLNHTLSRTLEELDQKSKEEGSFNVEPILRDIAFTMIGFILFSVDLNQEADRMRSALDICLNDFNKRISPLMPPMWIPTSGNLKKRSAHNYLHDTIFRLYEKRKSQKEQTRDFLSVLMQVRDEETGQPLSFEQINGELSTIILAGHETTASALAWIVYLIAKHPEWENRLLEEWKFDGLIPTYDDMANFPLTKMVIQEGMRLYPPVWSIVRSCLEGDQIDGYQIEKDSNIVVSFHNIHRHPDFWERPHEFYPEHFAPGKVNHLHDYAYLPFGSGQHFCLGRDLAMYEMMVGIPAIFKKYKLRIPQHARIVKESIISTRPKYGIEVTAEERSSNRI